MSRVSIFQPLIFSGVLFAAGRNTFFLLKHVPIGRCCGRYFFFCGSPWDEATNLE